jgi:glycine cleavage system pyridoxal-binding protein P
MLSALGYASMVEFENATVPAHIRVASESVTDSSIHSLSDSELLRHAGELAAKNEIFKSYIGMGYHTAVVPPVILRNVHTRRVSIRISLQYLTSPCSRLWKIQVWCLSPKHELDVYGDL